MASLQQLLEQQRDIERQIREAQTSLKGAVISEIRKLMHDNGLTVADLVGPAASGKSKSKGGASVAVRTVAPKYRHPETGATWSGRGLKPRWLSDELSKGRLQQDFAV